MTEKSATKEFHVLTIFDAVPVAPEVQARIPNALDAGDAGLIGMLRERAEELSGRLLQTNNLGTITLTSTFPQEGLAKTFHAFTLEEFGQGQHITVAGTDKVALAQNLVKLWETSHVKDTHEPQRAESGLSRRPPPGTQIH